MEQPRPPGRRRLAPPLIIACAVLGVCYHLRRTATAAVVSAGSSWAVLAPLSGGGGGGRDDDDGGDGNLAYGATVAPSASTTLAPSGTFAPTVASFSVFKRTHASVNALADGAFLSKHFGLNLTINETAWTGDGGIDGGLCAHRVGLQTLPGGFEIHLFESAVTPEGPIPNSEWVSYVKSLHNGFASADRDEIWDAFMANSMTFYAPDLTPFVRGLRGADVPIFAAKYRHTLNGAFCDDGESAGCEAVEFYSASVVVPHTGHLFEIVSEHLDSKLAGPFEAFPDNSCPAANMVRQPVQELRSLYKTSGGRMHGDNGLPDLMVVKLSFAGKAAEFAAFVEHVTRGVGPVDVDFEHYELDDDYVAAELPTASVARGSGKKRQGRGGDGGGDGGDGGGGDGGGGDGDGGGSDGGWCCTTKTSDPTERPLDSEKLCPQPGASHTPPFQPSPNESTRSSVQLVPGPASMGALEA